MRKTTIFQFFLVTLFFSINTHLSSCQDNTSKVLNKFTEYSEFPREYAFVHLNKSTYIKGESLGFTAYIFDKFDKAPSTATTNVYCIISDSLNHVVKKKLLLAKNGVVSNVFDIDSLFTSAKYKLSVYTNWMLNFPNERNSFTQKFTVLDPDTEIENKSSLSKYTIDILPEGGHMLYGVKNSVGIIVKDQNGFGLKNKSGYVLNKNNDVLTEFKLDNQGISKFLLIPRNDESYFVKISDDNGLELIKPITNIKKNGVSVIVTSVKNKKILSFSTNAETLPRISNNTYMFSIHNGNEMTTSNFSFDNKLTVSKAIENTNLFSGINVITVFDDNQNPILERIIFNDNNINVSKISQASYKSLSKDSLKISLKFDKAIDTSKIQNLSVSVLPSNTKSYTYNDNLLSRLYLEPYLKGRIENASYYFKDFTPKIKYDLDNLLLTQGWSSYNWDRIFGSKNEMTKEFEYGINAVTNVNGNKKSGNYVSYSTKNKNSEIFILEDDDVSFVQKGLFPLPEDKYKIGKSDSKVKPSVVSVFTPSSFPDFTPKQGINISHTNTLLSYTNTSDIGSKFLKIKETQALDEVVIRAAKKKTRIKKLQRQHIGQIDVIDDRIRNSSMTFAMYILNKGYQVRENFGQLSINIRNPVSLGGPTTPIVFLDGAQLSDFSVLANFRMEQIDYVVIDKLGSQLGVRGSAGVIRIFTDPLGPPRSSSKNDLLKIQKFPMTFSAKKKYYTPKYSEYDSDFFAEYGVVAWLPKVHIINNNTLEFNIIDTNLSSLNFFVEGFVNENNLISESKTIEIQD